MADKKEIKNGSSEAQNGSIEIQNSSSASPLFEIKKITKVYGEKVKTQVLHGLALFDGLLCDCKRREDQHIAARFARDGVGPRDLDAALAESGICEDRSAATTKRPLNQIALVRKQAIVARRNIQPFA